ncbi:response regulator [Desulfobacula toluolica]|uniref:Putative sensor protein n=1 Tax=Desulfobacula toluolica (strain DSM 7467 / Tol2) TaxID=651182 RepID=K0NKK2_DESTT|nr:response regulator [Desulfobacula toluolica]CCK79282.1 putative sensor protein [Desulfobacula toluolica Tol2]
MTDQKTILIIDDEVTIRDSLKSFFEDEDYLVFSAENGESGLDIFFNNQVDIVITDLRMPGMDGIEVMKTIHKSKPDTPLIVISGAGKKEDIIKALRMGAKDYITKPVEDLDMISHTVKQVLENKRLFEENKRYRKQLEKSEHQYRTITENIVEGVFTVDEHENFTYTNQAFCIMTGYSSDEILKKNIKDLSDEDNFKIIQQQTQNRKTGLSSRYEIQIFDKSNHPVHVELACSPIWSDTNIYKGSISVVRDITKFIELRKKFQRFLLQKDSNSKDILPICANCKSIKIEKNNWVQVEDYFSTIVFSHGICPACCEKLYPGFDFSVLDKNENDL